MDHSDNERRKPLPPLRGLRLTARDTPFHRQDNVYHNATRVVEHWLKQETSQRVRGAGRSSEVERSLMVRWVVGSTTGVTKAVVCVILSVGWCI